MFPASACGGLSRCESDRPGGLQQHGLQFTSEHSHGGLDGVRGGQALPYATHSRTACTCQSVGFIHCAGPQSSIVPAEVLAAERSARGPARQQQLLQRTWQGLILNSSKIALHPGLVSLDSTTFEKPAPDINAPALQDVLTQHCLPHLGPQHLALLHAASRSVHK